MYISVYMCVDVVQLAGVNFMQGTCTYLHLYVVSKPEFLHSSSATVFIYSIVV